MNAMKLYGGRGGMSSAKGGMTGIFNANSTSSGGNSQELLPAEINRINKTGDIKRLTDYFAEMHGGKNTEFAITIDKNGYATSYTAGVAGSVQPNEKYVPEALVVHNHPSSGWGNFSGEDLFYVANTDATGIVATSKKVSAPQGVSATTKKAYANRKAGIYTFEKGSHFKAEEFKEAIKNIKVHDINYDRDLGNWLKANQKKYGYKYTYEQ